MAGPAGALVGSGTAKEETKTVGGIKTVKVNFNFHSGQIQRRSSFPRGFTDFLDRCIYETSKGPVGIVQETVSTADEILKYKGLLDMGIITAEEFAIKKAQLLGL